MAATKMKSGISEATMEALAKWLEAVFMEHVEAGAAEDCAMWRKVHFLPLAHVPELKNLQNLLVWKKSHLSPRGHSPTK